MPNVTINLTKPIEGPAGTINAITLREPKFGDIMHLGEPVAFAHGAGGMVYHADKDDLFKGYIERLMIEPKDPLLLEQVSLGDALKLKDAVTSFFVIARAESSS
ncbi:hypothetical protein JQ604_12105 [Bradyrhizobium jicamae]|uniref:hypothetical protein n=1 Tax=Bradyrhizobium jicamae TaxID=280332 RepID=UPI001BADD2E7|nr:hypothetical protein [Bradyrhizobium jicamae]MBR0752929.1 hypothetical protein [Bradyrhizobium jicamae]